VAGALKVHQYAVSREEILEALEKALQTLKMTVVVRRSDYIEASSSLSLFSAGSILRISVDEVEESGTVLVSISGEPKRQLIDFGDLNTSKTVSLMAGIIAGMIGLFILMAGSISGGIIIIASIAPFLAWNHLKN